MKSINDIINEERGITLSLKSYEALMLRDFLRDCSDQDWHGFGTKEDKGNLESVLNKLNSKNV